MLATLGSLLRGEARRPQEVPVAPNYLFRLCMLEPNGFPENTGFVEMALPNGSCSPRPIQPWLYNIYLQSCAILLLESIPNQIVVNVQRVPATTACNIL